MQKLFTIALLVGIAVAMPVSAQVYKWKDAQGRTIISDTPRPGGGKDDLVVRGAQRDHLQEESDQPGQAATPGQSVADQELELRKRQQERQDAAATTEADKQAAAKLANDCRRAQNYLRSLESGRRIGVSDESGAVIPMEDDARQKAIEDTQAYLRQSCSG
ncbi:MAG: DUF4124 domain-containing protein [Betaproteobacteria bacterium]|nr:DUF4124 domain-containing protein [Betaproteobacteria bacterium]